MSGYIAVDLDGTLAEYGKWVGVDHIGAPIPAMVERVKAWVASGREVRIFTARMHGHGVFDMLTGKNIDALKPIEDWCLLHIGVILPVTNVKDFGMIELWDDRAVQVIPNTGQRADEQKYDAMRAHIVQLEAQIIEMEGRLANSREDNILLPPREVIVR